MSKRVDGIEPGGAAGPSVGEQNADGGGEQKCDDVNLQIEVEWHVDELRETDAKPELEENTEKSPNTGQCDRFDEELERDLATQDRIVESCPLAWESRRIERAGGDRALRP